MVILGASGWRNSKWVHSFSEHRVGGTEIHVREEYGLGGRHRIYVMTASERVRDQAEFMDFDGLNFK